MFNKVFNTNSNISIILRGNFIRADPDPVPGIFLSDPQPCPQVLIFKPIFDNQEFSPEPSSITSIILLRLNYQDYASKNYD